MLHSLYIAHFSEQSILLHRCSKSAGVRTIAPVPFGLVSQKVEERYYPGKTSSFKLLCISLIIRAAQCAVTMPAWAGKPLWVVISFCAVLSARSLLLQHALVQDSKTHGKERTPCSCRSDLLACPFAVLPLPHCWMDRRLRISIHSHHLADCLKKLGQIFSDAGYSNMCIASG